MGSTYCVDTGVAEKFSASKRLLVKSHHLAAES